jgi:hypothetical protein
MKTGIQVQSQPEWFASWFDSEHYHNLYSHRDDHEAAAFISRPENTVFEDPAML